MSSERCVSMSTNSNDEKHTVINAELMKPKELLDANISYTCVIQNGEHVYSSTERGVKPLLTWVNEGKDFSGFAAADKVVGKAAAFLYVLLNVDEMYAKVISVPAIDVLERYGIQVSFDEKVDAIRNRANTGFCPMESAVWEITEPAEALKVIRSKALELSQMKIEAKE